jgi:hypothetical protein
MAFVKGKSKDKSHRLLIKLSAIVSASLFSVPHR